MRKRVSLEILLSIVLFCGISEAFETKLIIRAKSKDAKFIGTKMGGALIVIKDSETGKILAEGLTAGGTGNTRKIMINPIKRFRKFADGSAMFETSIDIEEPKLITIEVDAPYISKPNMI